MSPKIISSDNWESQVVKGVSRDLDSAKLLFGLASDNDLSVQNDFFSELNLSEFEIVSIGRRPIIPR
ncbi:hypothetical protein FXB40_28915 [Bradyrhizobium rifense]|uniref:Uncharacterized protein n=1 Tax=Bradyrhizobium rifense TaxID=515499 RepID=A0A5D3KBJ3_9BRAD|nr:hypothetical protein [Bradyrhizobium rifense]TYL91325.1 hypothetical protein FXB40_28915 [Bradyrhizobium rifense]